MSCWSPGVPSRMASPSNCTAHVSRPVGAPEQEPLALPGRRLATARRIGAMNSKVCPTASAARPRRGAGPSPPRLGVPPVHGGLDRLHPLPEADAVVRGPGPSWSPGSAARNYSSRPAAPAPNQSSSPPAPGTPRRAAGRQPAAPLLRRPSHDGSPPRRGLPHPLAERRAPTGAPSPGAGSGRSPPIPGTTGTPGRPLAGRLPRRGLEGGGLPLEVPDIVHGGPFSRPPHDTLVPEDHHGPARWSQQIIVASARLGPVPLVPRSGCTRRGIRSACGSAPRRLRAGPAWTRRSGVRLGRRPGAGPLPARSSRLARGRDVIDIASGSGLVAIAAAMAGRRP